VTGSFSKKDIFCVWIPLHSFGTAEKETEEIVHSWKKRKMSDYFLFKS
jgi:hypothetical protein